MDQPTNNELLEQLGVGAGTLAARMNEIADAVARSDAAANLTHAQTVQAFAKLPNLVMTQEQDMGEDLGKLSYRDEAPALAVENHERIAYDSVEVEWDMKVTAHTGHQTELGGKEAVGAEVEAGVGLPFAGHVNVKATMSAELTHSDKQTRDTDMSARIRCKAAFKRQPPAPGLVAMIDRASRFADTCNELRLKAAVAKLSRLNAEVEAAAPAAA